MPKKKTTTKTADAMPGGDSESVLLQICRKNKVDSFPKQPVWDFQ